MNKNRLDLSILVISFNTVNLTLKCLYSVVEQTRDIEYEVIVVDNNSSDNSAQLISAEFPNFRMIALDKNVGFARANNMAAKEANGKRILLLNPDTVILNNAIDRLVAFADSRPDAKIWGGRAYFSDGAANASCWNSLTPWSITCRAFGLTWLFPRSKVFNPETVHMWSDFENEIEVNIIVGCFLMIDKNLWNELDGFNPIFYMYGDETDLCLRAKKLGARPRITPDAEIIHYGGGSEPSSEDKLVKVLKGQITVIRVHWSAHWYYYGRLAFFSMVALRAFGSLLIRPPKRKGGGRDQIDLVWGAVFQRRKEWINGWPN